MKNTFNIFYLIILACGMWGCSTQNNFAELETHNEPWEETTTEQEKTWLYGLDVTEKEIRQGKIKWKQTISDLLTGGNVSKEKINELITVSRKVQDVRKIKAGTIYTLIGDLIDSTTFVASHLIIEPDSRSFVTYHLGDSLFASYTERPVERNYRTLAGVIHSSVYQTVLEAGGSPILVGKMVDVLAWQVDFFRIQKGDRFKVIYEEESVGGQVINVPVVHGIYFEHFGKPFYGFHYVVDGEEDYFDEAGNSLRKAFLKAPLNYKRISSRFSPKRFHPVLKEYKAHLGTDYAADPGTPIMTVGDGVVVEAGYGQNNGNYVKIRHNSNYSTQYLHMQKLKTGIKPGVQVRQGEVIGYVGSTGLANGPHLCFRFWKNGVQVDATKVELPPSKPIAASSLPQFLHHKNVIQYKIDKISFQQHQDEIQHAASL